MYKFHYLPLYYGAKYIFNSPIQTYMTKTFLQNKSKLEKEYMQVKTKIENTFYLVSVVKLLSRKLFFSESKWHLVFFKKF